MWLSKSFKTVGGWRMHIRITKKNWWYMWIAFLTYYMFLAAWYLLIGVVWLIWLPFSLIIKAIKKHSARKKVRQMAHDGKIKITAEQGDGGYYMSERTVRHIQDEYANAREINRQAARNPQPQRKPAQPAQPRGKLIVDPQTGEILGEKPLDK